MDNNVSSSSRSQSSQPITEIVREISLWKRWKLSLMILLGATAIWVLLEVYEFNFVTIVSWLALLLVTSLFLWGNMLRLLGKEPPNMSGMEISEKAAIETAYTVRALIEEGVRWMFRVAAEEQLPITVSVVLGLWLLSYVGNLLDFPTFLFLGTVTGMSVPILLVKYEENLRRGVERMKAQARRIYDKLDEKVIKNVKVKVFKEKEKKEKKVE